METQNLPDQGAAAPTRWTGSGRVPHLKWESLPHHRRISHPATLRHVFGIPGDYVLGFYHQLFRSKLKVINTCDEQAAGFAGQQATLDACVCFATFAAVNRNRSQVKASRPADGSFYFGFYFSYWPSGQMRLR